MDAVDRKRLQGVAQPHDEAAQSVRERRAGDDDQQDGHRPGRLPAPTPSPSGQASWAWASGSNSDGVKYSHVGRAEHRANKDDLEIINGTTWNENIVCVRDVIDELGQLSRAALAAALRRDRAAAPVERRVQHHGLAHHLQRASSF